MKLFETVTGRKVLFGSLYFSEGAPIGFIWLALPTQLRSAGVPVEQITWLAAILVLPWTFKFAWAPVIDAVQTSSWTHRQWIIAAQSVMGSTLIPLFWINPVDQFGILAALLLVHACAAATQDVAIDAMCISMTEPEERAAYNAWMQVGMLLGRASMGGGALIIGQYLSREWVIALLILSTTFSMFLISAVPNSRSRSDRNSATREMMRSLKLAVTDFRTWLGLIFAFTGGAAFKSLEVIYGPFLVDRGYSELTIGWFSFGPMIGFMVAGALLGGWLTARHGSKVCVQWFLISIAVTVTLLAGVAYWGQSGRNAWLLVLLAATAVGIGAFTASSYTLFMNLTRPEIAATQFSAMMGATNGCESWSSYVSGRITASHGYPAAMLAMCLISLVAIPVIRMLPPLERTQIDEGE
ncbi:muropeptide transporter [Thalassoglobus neptunius]|uniref:Muropeptide transporter n=1 Tax=Thalassoglobus neptunius TaxID=1938619 RepID=A0A5C5X655_9PLAN|nr:MFS transporter [Thalassoglobus neptunius]TWT58420.1 muropeptide transporter [Thalassoglobus neptunius]